MHDRSPTHRARIAAPGGPRVSTASDGIRLVLGCAALLASNLLSSARAEEPPRAPDRAHIEAARELFRDAEALCTRDNGELWGISICGPIVYVDPATGFLIANAQNRQASFQAVEGVFAGQLPETAPVASTPTEIAGEIWTQLLWPIPGDEATRRVSIAHELFHRVWRQLPFAGPGAEDNRHLDRLEGRYLMQLEWRALARALAATRARARAAALADALAFRAERYRLFPLAAEQEAVLELNEGVAEYTGVRIGLETGDERVSYVLRSLAAHESDATFVRSFAYATGPAYGLLLDRFDPSWRSKLRVESRLDVMLAAAARSRAGDATIAQRAGRYDEASGLRQAESEREAQRQARLAQYRQTFIEGPVLTLALSADSRRTFRPPTLIAFEDVGIIYPFLVLTDSWGVLEVTSGDGALLRGGDAPTAVVSLDGADAGALRGEGWVLRLNPGWSIQRAARDGDLTVAERSAAGRRE